MDLRMPLAPYMRRFLFVCLFSWKWMEYPFWNAIREVSRNTCNKDGYVMLHGEKRSLEG